MTKSRLVVVWICNFSNPSLRSRLVFNKSLLEGLLRKISGSNQAIQYSDYGVWITNAVEEVKSFQDIELHVITPHYGIKGDIQEFCIEGVYYHVYPDESFQVWWKIMDRLGLVGNNESFKKNRSIINHIVQSIRPDIVHFIGAENVNYSLAALDIDNSLPLVVQLQTLVADHRVFNSLGRHREMFREGERRVLRRADYIFTIAKTYMTIIKQEIAPDAVFIANKLAIGVTVDRHHVKKEYDFVYCSIDISKAADLAIESFALAKKSFPNITLDIIGHYSTEYKAKLDELITNLSINGSVFFEGRLPTHDDVMNQLKKARFALLPLRPDLLPSTIREAMSVGCPVITTLTESTPILNSERETILICKPEDSIDISQKMCLLLSDEQYANHIRENAYLTVEERYDNKAAMRKTVDSYFAIFEHFHNNTPIPEKFLS